MKIQTKINSRSKGNRGEREAARILKTWTNKDFARVPSSGGLQWKNSNAKGDIVCSEEGHFFPFCMEIKNYREINFEHLLYTKKPIVEEFWAQCSRDAEIARKAPMLWMRYDRLPKGFHFVGIPLKLYIKVLKEYLPKDTRMMKVPHLKLVIITTEALLSIPYKEIRKTVKKLYRS